MRYLLAFGNPLIDFDNLALKVADELLAENLSGIEIVKCISPDEILNYIGKDFIILDVADLDKVALIEDIDKITNSPSASLHDFDLGFFLRLLKETGRIEKVRIICLPQDMAVSAAKKAVQDILKSVG